MNDPNQRICVYRYAQLVPVRLGMKHLKRYAHYLTDGAGMGDSMVQQNQIG